ncbi:uncharacterized protein LOC131642320 [Vicia villosa]|uniref:uncharacterized protein LOC131642320 n=1 Tax=Vicia villosa TaxID=3911 RepID=UPI00273BC891|nr:uncharacterized protein LOC131642320 [Vicia villosa]
MSVLVNGSPTKEFVVEKGLRQGDPLSPFLCLGSIGLNECKVDILQFADDSFGGEGSWKQVWAIKAMLGAFELVSGVSINYHKRKLIGINTRSNFMEVATYVLSCKVESSNFTFLGVPIGSNPRKYSTWVPLLNKMKKRLSGWKNRFLNLGGRITLLKSILGALTIFTMSFYKMSARVAKELTSVWRVLQGFDNLWYDLLKARYRDISRKMYNGGVSGRVSISQSSWWKDILKIGSFSLRDPIVAYSKFVIGNGFNTPFWKARWLKDASLRE